MYTFVYTYDDIYVYMYNNVKTCVFDLFITIECDI